MAALHHYAFMLFISAVDLLFSSDIIIIIISATYCHYYFERHYIATVNITLHCRHCRR